MDLGLTERQEMLKDNARTFFDRECPTKSVRELLASPDGHSPRLWNDMADLGWLGLPFPEELGGIGLSFVDLAVVLEEMGRALLPSPFVATVLLAGYPILEAGSAAQKEELLPRIAAGDLILTLGLLESAVTYDPCDVKLTAVPDGDRLVLNGTKLFVPYAQVANVIVTAAQVPDGDGRLVQKLLLVNAHDPGVNKTLLLSIDDSKVYEVVYDGVAVRREDVLDGADTASVIEKTLDRAAVGECLQLIGGAAVCLEMAVKHAKSRSQFGQLIGAFQAIQHLCADSITDLDAARCLTYQAAWRISEGLPSKREVAIAKAWVSDACHRILTRAHQVHGGSGFIAEHDITLYNKRTRAGELAFGDPNYHYRNLGQMLAG